MKKSRRTPAEERQKAKDQAKRKALKVIRRVETAAQTKGVALSEWEGDFLGSLAERIATFGRAFADLEKGASGSALSVLQMRKLREIAAKTEAEIGAGVPGVDDPDAGAADPAAAAQAGRPSKRSGFGKAARRPPGGARTRRGGPGFSG